MMSKKSFSGVVGVYRVMAELLERGILASHVIIDNGADIILNNGKRIQVRRKRVDNDGSIRMSSCKLGNNFDFLIVWGYGNQDYFYIIPRKVISHLLATPKSLFFKPLKRTDLYKKFLNRWRF